MATRPREVQRQTCRSRRWRTLIGQWKSFLGGHVGFSVSPRIAADAQERTVGRVASRAVPVFVGIDWGGEHHRVCVVDGAGRRHANAEVTHDVADTRTRRVTHDVAD